MRVAVWGGGVACGLLVVFALICCERAAVCAEPNGPTALDKGASSGQLMALSADLADGRQQITLIAPKTRVMGVYQIDRASGEISLKSVRSVHWDLLLEEFNSDKPSPREIRSLLDKR